MSVPAKLLPKIGFRDFDQAVVNQLGAEIVSVPDGVEVPKNFQRTQFCANVRGVRGPDLYGGKVPIVMIPAGSAFVPYLLPCFAIHPGDPRLALDRWHSNERIREPARGAREVTTVNSLGETVTGFSAYVEREGSMPWDITYDIQVFAANRNTLMRMISHLTHEDHFYPRGGRLVITKEESDFTYEYLVGGLNNLSEVISANDTTQGYVYVITVLAMVDHVDETDELDAIPAMTSGAPTIVVSAGTTTP